MKILLIHSDFIEFEAKEKALKSAENIDKKKHRIEDCLVVFTSTEKSDSIEIVEKACNEIISVAEQVGARRIVVYPFVHLTSTPSDPSTALKIISSIESALKAKNYEVHHAPFGWYKSFDIKCKGHPLSELSRDISLHERIEKKPVKIGKIILDRRNLPPNDHRIIGEDTGIFHFSEEVGAGLPLWLPRGEVLHETLESFMRDMEKKYGYVYVRTPHITRGALYEKTGHIPYYKDSMYAPVDIEGEEYYLKPMNCPHHHMIYTKLVNSYRDLPLRLAEAGTTYRNELSGVTYGLIRTKCFTQNDAHIYVTPDQLKEEFVSVLKLFQEVYEIMQIKDYWFRLSLPDFKNNPDKFTGDPSEWNHACDEIRKAMQESGKKFVEEVGEAAFYGPKIDVQIKNTQGKEETIATSQVDIVVPKRIGLAYTDSEGNKKTPIIIHRAILGSYERFIAYLLEQTKGSLPLWLAPVQVRVISFTDRNIESVKKFAQELVSAGIRADIDVSATTVEYKVRNAQILKIPYTITIGDKEEKSDTLAVRKRDGKVVFGVEKSNFIIDLIKEIEDKN